MPTSYIFPWHIIAKPSQFYKGYIIHKRTLSGNPLYFTNCLKGSPCFITITQFISFWKLSIFILSQTQAISSNKNLNLIFQFAIMWQSNINWCHTYLSTRFLFRLNYFSRGRETFVTIFSCCTKMISNYLCVNKYITIPSAFECSKKKFEQQCSNIIEHLKRHMEYNVSSKSGEN